MLPTLDCHPAQQQVFLLYALSTDVAKDEMEETEQVSQGRQPSNPCHDLLEPGGWAKVYLDHVRWRVELATFLEWQA